MICRSFRVVFFLVVFFAARSTAWLRGVSTVGCSKPVLPFFAVAKKARWRRSRRWLVSQLESVGSPLSVSEVKAHRTQFFCVRRCLIAVCAVILAWVVCRCPLPVTTR